MRHCEYTKPNGTFCGSPALRGRDYCHWHVTFIARRLRAEKQAATCDPTPPELPPLEDANSIQLAIMTVMDAILHDRIGPRKAGQLSYLLQLASNNLKQGVNFHPVTQSASPEKDGEAKTEEVVLCSSYDSLEADYDIREHAEQLKASAANQRIDAGKQADQEEEADAQEQQEQQDKQDQQEQLSEEEQFLREARQYGWFEEGFGPTSPYFEGYFLGWKYRKQKEEEERRQREEEEEAQRRKQQQEYQELWNQIRSCLELALAGDELKVLQDALCTCYRVSGLEYETKGWKPASAQLVLFPRKPPEKVQQQWYEQRQANCNAAWDKSFVDQEAARKKTI